MENFRIESLEINKIGAFEHLKIEFPKKTDPDKAEIHILTGENGTGKSTILEALAEIGKHKIDNSEQNIFIDKLIDNDSLIDVITHPKKYSTSFNFDDILQNNISKYVIGNEIQSNIKKYHGVVDFALFAYSGYRRINKSDMVTIDKVRFDYPEALTNALDFDKSINTEKLIHWLGNAFIQESLSISNGQKDRAKKYRAYIETIERIIEKITNDKVKLVLNPDSMHLNIIINEQRMALTTLPDGLKSLISWIGDLVMRMYQTKEGYTQIFDRNFILFLDEIEVHLHPAWQRKILPVVQKLFKNAQIFISTHSPFVVGSVDGAWVHKLKKVGAYAVLDGEPILSEDAESYDTILEEIFGIKERFGNEIESKLDRFRKITKEILKGNEENLEEWNTIITFFQNQNRPDEIMAVIAPQIHQINRIRKQVIA